MSSFFSGKRAPAANSDDVESDEAASDGGWAKLRNLVIGKPGKPMSKKVPAIVTLAGVMMLVAFAVVLERKWGGLSRAKLRIVGPGEYDQLKKAALILRNEVFRWNKLNNPEDTPEEYFKGITIKNEDMIEKYKEDFVNPSPDLKEYKIRSKVWEKYILPYATAADISLLRYCATEFELFRDYVQSQGFNDVQLSDNVEWSTLFQFDSKSFKEHVDTLEEEGQEIPEKLRFYRENIDSYIKATKSYLLTRRVFMSFIKSIHPEAGNTHPDGEETRALKKIKVGKYKNKEAKEEGGRDIEEAEEDVKDS